MSIDRNHSEQFERYLKGQMSPKEANAFEREVLDDPFAQEALKGFEAHGANALNDLNKLRNQIATQKKKPISYMRIAAVVALLIIGSFSVYEFTNQIEGEHLAMEEEPIEGLIQAIPAPDTVSIPDTQELELADGTLTTEEAPVESIKPDEARNDEAAQVAMVEQAEEELAVEAISDEVLAEVQEAEIQEVNESDSDDAVDFSDVLQSRTSGMQVKSAEVAPKAIFLDTSALDDIVITAQPLVAKKESLGNAINETDEESAKTSKRAKATPRAATQRSASTSVATISGKVTDDAGEPLPGVSIIIQGTTTGVTTDVDGIYQLPKVGDLTLIFTYVGFETQEIEAGDRSTIDVTMGGATELQEVVVTGYSEDSFQESPSYSPARPKDGNRAFKDYLEVNLKYPDTAKTNEVEGTVILELTINASGEISDITIKKSLGFGCDQEAIRLVREGPEWNAAEKDGNNVEDKVRVRVKFKLDR